MQIDDKILGQMGWPKWRKLLMVAISIVVIFASVMAMAILIVGVLARLTAYQFSLDFESYSGLFWGLLIFSGAFFGLWPILRFFYKRSLLSLINPFGLPTWQQFLLGLAYAALLLVIGQISSEIFAHEKMSWAYRGELAIWLVWLLPYIIAVLIQTSAEEVVFRGYLQQYLASVVSWRWVYYVVPSALWASLHFGNIPNMPMTDTASVLSTFVLGLVLADWAARSGALAGPIAMHFLNNFVLFAVVGYSLQPADMQLVRIDVSAMGDGELAIATLFSAALMVAIYLPFRPAITRSPEGSPEVV